MNWADPLAARTGQCVQVGVLDADSTDEVAIVHHVFRPDGRPQRLETGARHPVHATALGKVLLAYRPSQSGGGLTAFTQRTITDPPRLGNELRTVRTAGHAVEVEEYEHGRAAIAVPINGNGGLVVAAVAIVGDPVDLCDAGTQAKPAQLTRLRDCAQHITGELATTRMTAR